MNDEIREILDYLKNDDYSPVFVDEGCDDTPYKLFDEIEVKLLLDYITNLQKEVRVNNDLIPHFKNRVKELKKEITNLQNENERLKELVDADNESYDIQETIINRQKSELLEQEDYKSRCEKASEYFKYQLENLDFYEDTKARMLCAMGITLLQNGSESK